MRFLLDTDTCIYLIKQQPPAVLKRFQTLQAGDVGLSVVTFAELLYGAYKSQQEERNLARLHELADALPVLPFDDAAADAYARLRTELERRGALIGPYDMLIAGHALAVSAVLVTHNVREFSRVDGLDIDDWTRP